MAKLDACPTENTLKDLIEGKIGEPALSDLSEHLERCGGCQEKAKTLSGMDTFVDPLRTESGDVKKIAEGVPAPLVEKVKQMARVASAGDTIALEDGESDPKSDPELNFLAPPQEPDEIGRLGTYRILKVLGKGGMGMVFLGHDPQLDRAVAVKIMLPKFAANRDAKQRFLREARAAAKLKSDHIVSIYQVSEDRGVPFLAMEYLEGAPLDQFLQGNRRLSVPQIVRIGRETAKGLAAAHEKGLIHRDIKPGNLWLDKTHAGRVKILDFGLARSEKEDVHLTQSGAIVGTPAYMAPEQARGDKAVDARADLFSLGCVLYRLCAGEIPFKGETTMGVLLAIAMNEPTAPVRIDPNIPAPLSDLIMQLLDKDPARRPASAREVIERLNAVEKGRADARGDTLEIPAQVVPETASRGDGPTVSLPAAEPAAETRSITAPSPKLDSATSGSGSGRWWALVAGLLLLGGGVFGAYQLFFDTPHGRIIVQIDDDAIEARFKKGKLELYGPDNKLMYTLEPSQRDKTLPPGNYGIKVAGADGLELDTDKFEMKRGGKVIVRILLDRVALAKKEIEVKPVKDGPKVLSPSFALEFDGKGWVDVPTLNFDGQSRITVEALVLLDPIASKFVIAPTIAGVVEQFIMSYRAESNAARLMSFGNGTPVDLILPTPKRWVHVAAVRDGGKSYLFVDGKMSEERVHKDAPPPDSKNFFKIGRQYLYGQIREVRASKSVRYTKDFTPATRFENDADTLALYHFDEGKGDLLKDSSGNGHHGKIIGAKWVTADGAPIPAVADNRPQLIATIDDETAPFVAFGPEDQSLVTGGVDLVFYDSVKGGLLHREKLGSFINIVSQSKDRKALAIGGALGEIRVIELPSRKVLFKVPTKKAQISFALSPGGKTLAYEDDAGLAIRDLSSGKIERGMKPDQGSFFGLKFSPDGRYLAGINNEKLYVFSTKDYSLVFQQPINDHSPWCDITADGKLIAVGGRIGTGGQPAFQWFSIPEGRLVFQEPNLPALPMAGAFSPDGSYFVLGQRNGWVSLYRVADKLQLAAWQVAGPAPETLMHLAFSSDGKRLATAVMGGQTKIWDLSKLALAKESTPPIGGDYALRLAGGDSVTIPGPKLDLAGPWTLEGYYMPLEKAPNKQYASVLSVSGQLSLSLNQDQSWYFSLAGGKSPGLLSVVRETPKRIHVAVVRSEGEIRLYRDGKLQKKDSFEGTLSAPAGVFMIGGHYNGLIDEVRISKVARYRADFTPAPRLASDADTLALYHCDEGQGDKLTDSSGNGHHGKIVGAKWVRADGTPIPTPQPSNYALEFDGKWTHVNVSSLRCETDQPLTVEARVKFRQAMGVTETIASSYSPKSAMLLCRSNGTNPAFLARQNLDARFAGLEGTLENDTWLHLAGVWDGKTVRLFVNGKLQPKVVEKKLNLQMTAPQDQHLILGADRVVLGQPLGGFFHGLMDELRISKIARYTSDFTPEHRFTTDPNTLALYHFDEGEGDKLTDSSGNGHHGKIVGAKWAKVETAPIDPPLNTFTNSLGMKFALVPKGKSWLGGGNGKPGDKEVEFKEDFYLGVYEVTQEEWAKVMGTNPSVHQNVPGVAKDRIAKFPVENVSFPETLEYIKRLNELAKDSGWEYRLPTEAEWEYACRGGPMKDREESKFECYFAAPTNEPMSSQANYAHAMGLKRPQEVGSYPPNRLGFHDMHGNVAEWCGDAIAKEGATPNRIYRGGSWDDNAASIGVNSRDSKGAVPNTKAPTIGLRVARVRRADPDRRAAEYVLSLGGSVRVNGEIREIKAVADLPNERLSLTWFSLAENKQVNDAALAPLKDCKNLMVLHLGNTSVSDAGLAYFKDCPNLTQLHLHLTKVSDMGLAQFKDCKNLTQVHLGGTQIGDAGIGHLKDCKNLATIGLWGTKVTDASVKNLVGLTKLQSLNVKRTKVTATGLDALKKALPNCKIEHDGGVIEPRTAADVDRKAAEWVMMRRKGALGVRIDGQYVFVPENGKLPDEPFQLDGIQLIDPTVGDNDLSRFAGLPELKGINLHICPITEAGLEKLVPLPKLENMNLERTKVTTAGLATLRKFPTLRELVLTETALEDAGLTHLAALVNLEKLFLKRTGLSETGVRKLAEALPNCRIEWDGGVIEPTVGTSPEKQAELVRWLFENKKVKSGMIVEQDGKTIAINDAGKIPAGPFRVKSASFHTFFHGGNLVQEDFPKLAAFTDLETLELGRTVITDAGLRTLLPLKNLRSLALFFTVLTPESAKTLREFPNLSHLEIPSGDDWLKNLAGMPSLRSLRFYKSTISALGMDTLKDHPNLAELQFHDMKFAEGSLMKLTAVKTLRLLNFHESEATLEEAKQLAEAMPWCEVRFVGRGEKKATTFNEGRAERDRKAAEWVLSVGGSVRIDGRVSSPIDKVADLPAKPFRLTSVLLTGDTLEASPGLAHFKECKDLTLLSLGYKKVSEEALAQFSACTTLQVLSLSGSNATDAGLAHFKNCKSLVMLELNDTAVTDAGLAHFKECSKLQQLMLRGTQVTDASLPLLSGWKGLIQLRLTGTKVTPAAIGTLHKALPKCRIIHDGGEIGPMGSIGPEFLENRWWTAMAWGHP